MQQVPLVNYESGRRTIVGTAVVKDDGTIQATLDPGDEGLKLLRMLRDFGEVSINRKYDRGDI